MLLFVLPNIAGIFITKLSNAPFIWKRSVLEIRIFLASDQETIFNRKVRFTILVCSKAQAKACGYTQIPVGAGFSLR